MKTYRSPIYHKTDAEYFKANEKDLFLKTREKQPFQRHFRKNGQKRNRKYNSKLHSSISKLYIHVW